MLFCVVKWKHSPDWKDHRPGISSKCGNRLTLSLKKQQRRNVAIGETKRGMGHSVYMKKSFANETQVMDWVRTGGVGRIVYELDPVLGSGSMIIQRLSPMCFVALVDFACERCPNTPTNPLDTGHGRWFTVNCCFEGRCEVSAGSQGFAVVKAGDCCVSCADSWPEEFSYPLGIYRGIELWVNTELEHDQSLSLLKQAAVSLEEIAKNAGLAAVFSDDDLLNSPLHRMAALLGDPGIASERALAGCKIELMRFFFALSDYDLAAAKPVSLLSPRQMQVVKSMSKRMRDNLLDTYDARAMASEVGVSAATLNNWFKGFYGLTVSAYLRHLRIEKASDMLAKGVSVAEASAGVGYANQSKFAAVFKRERGLSPSDFRRSHQSFEHKHTSMVCEQKQCGIL